MRKRRISERDTHAILSGQTPATRPDLAPLADSIAEFRMAALESPVRPSPDLVSRLGLLGESQDSSRTESQPGTGESRKRVTMFSWIAGMGLLAKIALGTGVAVAATAGAGAAGVLPNGAQDAFDQVISTVVPSVQDDEATEPATDDSEPDPASTDHPDNFGSWVSERAKDPDKVGRDFGKETSEAAKQNGNGPKTTDGEEGAGTESGTDSGDDATTSGPGNSGSGNSNGHGKPEGTPGKP